MIQAEARRPEVELRVDQLAHRGAFRALAAGWSELLAEAGATAAPGPFVEPGWMAVTAAHLLGPAGAGRTLRLLAAHDGERLAGVLPLLVERRRLGGVPARVLRSLSDDHSQRFDLVATGETAVRALWRHLASPACADWDVLELRDVPDGASHARRLHELARSEGWPVATWTSQRSPYLALPPTVEELERRLDAKFRANLRRRRRNLAKLGAVELETVRGLRDAEGRLGARAHGRALDALLDEGLALERSGWKGELGTAIACDPAMTARYRGLARLAAYRGELSLHFLRVGGRRVAFHFAVEVGGVYYLFKPGLDESLRRYGPGHLLVWEVARALVERGGSELDFLGDDMPWKQDWTSSVRQHSWLYVYRPTAFGRALHAWKTRALPALGRARVAAQEWYTRWSAADQATATAAATATTEED